MSQVTKPVFLDETGKKIAEELETQRTVLHTFNEQVGENMSVQTQILRETAQKITDEMHAQTAMLSAIAKEPISKITSWEDIQSLVKRGLASEIFQIGDQFKITWITQGQAHDEDDNSIYCSGQHTLTFDIVDFGNATLRGGFEVPGMYLQCHFAVPVTVPYDPAEKEKASGTFEMDRYYYRVDASMSSGYRLLKVSADYVIGKPIPDDGTYYQCEIYDPNGLVLSRGYNRWSTSWIRKWLNSSSVRYWFVPDHIGDVGFTPIDYYEADEGQKPFNVESGFMYDLYSIKNNGVTRDPFVSVIGPVKVSTFVNSIGDGINENVTNTLEDTYDTFFLPSLEQVYAVPQRAGEGKYFEYWKRATGAATPNERMGNGNPGYITQNGNKGPVLSYLRSAHAGSTQSVWYLTKDGVISYGSALHPHYVCPVCVVH